MKPQWPLTRSAPIPIPRRKAQSDCPSFFSDHNPLKAEQLEQKSAAREALKASCSTMKKLSAKNDKQKNVITDEEQEEQEEQEEETHTLQFGEHFSL